VHVSARTYLALIHLLYLFKDRVAIVDLLIRVVEIIGDPTAALFWIDLNYRIIRDDHPDVYNSVTQTFDDYDGFVSSPGPSLDGRNERKRMWGLLFATILAGLVVVGQQVEQKFFFYWPTETTQCQVRHFLFTRMMLMIDY
jgi:hypothetical protein